MKKIKKDKLNQPKILIRIPVPKPGSAHGDKKYNRNKQKINDLQHKKEIE